MRFDFKGQSYEVSEDNVMFSVDENSSITGILFREPVKEKSRWRVKLSTRRGSGNADSRLIFESDDYDACRSIFDLEKKRLVEGLMLTTDTGLKLDVSNSSSPCGTSFIVTDINDGVEYYLRLTKY